MRMPRWLQSGRVIVGGLIVAAVVFVAAFALHLAPHDPDEQNLLTTLLPFGVDPDYFLGTDSLGRDVVSRLIFGMRTALSVALSAALGAMLIGSVLAYLAGYFGGWVDWLIGRAVDIWMSFPPVVLSLILMTGSRHRRAQRDPGDHPGGLDAVLPGAAQRGDGGDAARLRGGGASSVGFGHWRTVIARGRAGDACRCC